VFFFLSISVLKVYLKGGFFMAVSSEQAMKRALELARKGYVRVYPHPMAGAVSVKEGMIIGEGWHRGPGHPHAEVEALKRCTVDPQGAVLYVTLEPCNHFGRTPPCTEAIIKAGIGKVCYAVADPNPHVAGGGARKLREAGILAVEGIGKDEAIRLNQAYFHHCHTGLPWVILKAGMSLDGKIALAGGESQWITGTKSREKVHQLRARVGAILIGSGTVQRDNPRLTCRWGDSKQRQPLKAVLDSNLVLDLESRLVQESPERLVVFCSAEAPRDKEKALTERGVRVFRVKTQGKPDPRKVMVALGEMGVQSVLIEGGHQIFTAFVEAGLVNEYYLFYAPFWIGGDESIGVLGGSGLKSLAEKVPIKVESIRRYGDDFLVHGYANR